jgi:hypothetical protein
MHSAPSSPWGVWTTDYPVGPNYGTAYNTGAAIGDAFYDVSNFAAPYTWIGTWGPAPAATDWYLQALLQAPTTEPPIWYAINREATPSDTAINLETQPTGRGHPIVHLNPGDVLSVNAPTPDGVGLWHAVFGFTGSVSTTGTIGYLNNMPGIGPRRFGFGTNGHIYTGFLDANVSTGFGLAPHYTGAVFSNVYEIDPTGAGTVVNNAGGSGDDINGLPGLNGFWLDPATNDVWVGDGPGINQMQAASSLSVGAFIEIPDFMVFANGWYDGCVYGFDLATSNNTFYMVTKTNVIYTVPFATPDNAHVSSFTISSRKGMRPRNIRYVGFKSRLYIPTMSDNAVLEVNPATNTVTNTFTGFDCPWDIVATDSKVFAIQLGKVGLKEVPIS